MIDKASQEFLVKLLDVPSPSGYEEEAVKLIMSGREEE